MARHCRILLLTLIVVGVSGNALLAQERKVYNSLLWEISGNGLKSPSYLYGTMHVSKKMVFNLSDTFFIALSNTAAVALEQNPSGWMDEMVESGEFSKRNPRLFNSNYSLYGVFKIDSLRDENLASFLSRGNYFANALLYRNSRDKDFEEDTYLDLFIYQNASKKGKPVLGLEINREVEKLAKKAREESMKEAFSGYRPYIGFDQLEDAYRKGDLNALDSLHDLQYDGTAFRKYMLDERNINMVEKLDSILKTGLTLFIGVGAAHLPGDIGMIELLRAKGYTVRAVSQHASEFSQNQRQKQEATIFPVTGKWFVSPDSMFKAKVPGKPYLMNSGLLLTEYFYPEMTNGIYYNITLLRTGGALFGASADKTANRINNLLYENIPGKIISRSMQNKNGVHEILVVNETRKGEHQMYKILVNDNLILIAKVSGTLAFGYSEMGKDFINSIELLGRNGNGGAINLNGFDVLAPKGRINESFSLNGQTRSEYSIAEINGENNWLLMHANFFDFTYIEEDSFEIHFIPQEFIRTSSGSVERYSDFTVNQQQGTWYVWKNNKGAVLTTLSFKKGHDYYMLTTDSHDSIQLTEIAQSLKRTAVQDEPWVEYLDSGLQFKSRLPESMSVFNHNLQEIPEMEEFSWLSDFGSGRANESVYITDEQGQRVILVRKNRFDDYMSFDAMDGFWKMVDFHGDLKLHKEQTNQKDGLVIRSVEYRIPLSDNALFRTYILKNRLLFTVSGMGDTTTGMTEFNKKFLEYFQITDTLIGEPLQVSRKDRFFEDLMGSDSTRAIDALQSVHYMKFDEKDLDILIPLLTNVEFLEQSHFAERNVYSQVLQMIAGVGHEKATSLLRSLYVEHPDSSGLQLMVVEALSRNANKRNYKVLKDLLLDEVPVFDKYALQTLFGNFQANPKLAVSLYPDIINLTRNHTYREPVYNLAGFLIENRHMPSRKIKKFQKELIADASEEIKSRLSQRYGYYDEYGEYADFSEETLEEVMAEIEKMENEMGVIPADLRREIDEFLAYFVPKADILETYITLLARFQKDKGSKRFFTHLKRWINQNQKIQYQLRLLELGIDDNLDEFAGLAEKLSLRFRVYQALKKIGMEKLFNPDYLNQESMALAIIAKENAYGVDFDKDSIEFVGKRFVACKGGKSGYVYFFTRSNEEYRSTELMHIGLMPADSTDFNLSLVSKSSGKRLRSTNEDDLSKAMDEVMRNFVVHGRKRARSSARYDDWMDYWE
jgi:uncharacterized protein YbaP (TraB family)